MQMLLLLAKRLSCSVIRPLFDARRHHRPLLSRRGYASATQKPTNSMMVDYLIASFGFSPDKAAVISKPLADLKSPDKPEAVRRFLNHQGFSEADVKVLITLQPNILSASPEDILNPNFRALRDVGLSSSALTQLILAAPDALQTSSVLILAAPDALQTSSVVPRIKFWRDFFEGDETALVKALKNNPGLSNHDISRIVTPKISLLQSHGLCSDDIQRIVLKAPPLITTRIGLLEETLKRAKELGFQPESGTFVIGLHALLSVNREALNKKMELLKSFGLLEDEFISALRKGPGMIMLTENTLRVKMDFLLGEARCDPSYIASNPVLLLVSLEKRLRPRLHVLRLLESKGLYDEGQNFSSVIRMTNTEFVERFILPHKEEILGLHKGYFAAIA